MVYTITENALIPKTDRPQIHAEEMDTTKLLCP
jgi:hypothetical protein